MPKSDIWMKDQWVDVREKIATRWPEIEIDDLDTTQGDVSQLISLIQQQYGLSSDIAARQLVDFLERIGS